MKILFIFWATFNLWKKIIMLYFTQLWFKKTLGQYSKKRKNNFFKKLSSKTEKETCLKDLE